MDRYLSDPYLANLVPWDLVAAFTQKIRDYHTVFYGSNYYWEELSASKASAFVGETVVLGLVGKHLAMYLLTSDEAQLKKLRENLDYLFSRTGTR